MTLSTLLTGRALDLYSRLPIEKADSYKELKLALLHRYDFTEEGFRTKFERSGRRRREVSLLTRPNINILYLNSHY